MSLPPDVKKAYGVVMALGTKLGERARHEPELLGQLRATDAREAFVRLVREKAEGLAPPTLVDAFEGLVTEADWVQWRSRLLVQAKMTQAGGKPVPGHEQGRGVGRP